MPPFLALAEAKVSCADPSCHSRSSGHCSSVTGNGGGDVTLLGNAFVLLAMISWACATVISRPLLDHFPATRLAYLATLVSLPVHWLIALPHLAPVGDGLGAPMWIGIVYSGLFSTGCPNRERRARSPATRGWPPRRRSRNRRRRPAPR